MLDYEKWNWLFVQNVCLWVTDRCTSSRGFREPTLFKVRESCTDRIFAPKVLPIKIINWNLITKLEEEKKLYRNRRCVFKRSFLSIEFQRNSKILTRRWNDLARTGENWKMILGGRVFSFLHPYHLLSRSRETRQLPPLPFFLFSNTSIPLKSRIFHSQVYVCATNRVVIL